MCLVLLVFETFGAWYLVCGNGDGDARLALGRRGMLLKREKRQLFDREVLLVLGTFGAFGAFDAFGAFGTFGSFGTFSTFGRSM